MSNAYDWKAEIDWPAEGYVDPDTDEKHAWTDLVPDDNGVVHPEDGYTYQDLVGDQAEAVHMEVQEFLESSRYDRDGWWADDEDDDPGAVGDYPED